MFVVDSFFLKRFTSWFSHSLSLFFFVAKTCCYDEDFFFQKFQAKGRKKEEYIKIKSAHTNGFFLERK